MISLETQTWDPLDLGLSLSIGLKITKLKRIWAEKTEKIRIYPK